MCKRKDDNFLPWFSISVTFESEEVFDEDEDDTWDWYWW